MRHVISDFLLKRIAPLQERSREAWSYSGMLDRTRIQPGLAGELPQAIYSLLMRQLTGHYYRIALLSRVDFRHLTRVSSRDRYRATANYLVVACGPARDRR